MTDHMQVYLYLFILGGLALGLATYATLREVKRGDFRGRDQLTPSQMRGLRHTAAALLMERNHARRSSRKR